MPLNSPYDRLVTLNPHIEMLARRFYYQFKPSLEKFTIRKTKQSSASSRTSGELYNVIEHIRNIVNEKDDILIIHSTFSALKHFDLSPEKMLEYLIDKLGPGITIAMPAIPIYPNEVSKTPLSETELAAQCYTYSIKSTRVWTGALPRAMIKHHCSHRSKFPLNTMIAVGPRAKQMMENNLESDTACGIGSAWHYCASNDALIVGLGTDLTHSLTMIHAAEDMHPEHWSVKDWYLTRTFRIKDNTSTKTITVKERRHHWGKLHFAERCLARDLMRNNLLDSTNIEQTIVESIRASALLQHLNSRKSTGYPYYWLPKR